MWNKAGDFCYNMQTRGLGTQNPTRLSFQLVCFNFYFLMIWKRKFEQIQLDIVIMLECVTGATVSKISIEHITSFLRKCISKRCHNYHVTALTWGYSPTHQHKSLSKWRHVWAYVWLISPQMMAHFITVLCRGPHLLSFNITLGSWLA